MHHLIHYRYIKGSDQNGPFETKAGTSIKEMRGQLKQLYNSHLDMMQRHELLGVDFEIIPEDFLVRTFAPDGTIEFEHIFYLWSDNADDSNPVMGQPSDIN